MLPIPATLLLLQGVGYYEDDAYTVLSDIIASPDYPGHAPSARTGAHASIALGSASAAAASTGAGGNVSAAGGLGGGGASAGEEARIKKSRLERIAEQQAARHAAGGKGGGRGKRDDEELDPMDPVSVCVWLKVD